MSTEGHKNVENAHNDAARDARSRRLSKQQRLEVFGGMREIVKVDLS